MPEDVPNYLPLRLISMGYDFSGRKTLATHLKNKFDIEVLEMPEIIKEAFSLTLEENDPRKTSKVLKSLPESSPKHNPEFNEEGNEINEMELPELELRQVGLEMIQYLENGSEIPDELYIKAIKAKIREFYEPLDNEKFLDVIRSEKQKEEERIVQIRKELDREEARKKKRKETGVTPLEKELTDKLRRRNYYRKGWMLIGYPNNYN